MDGPGLASGVEQARTQAVEGLWGIRSASPPARLGGQLAPAASSARRGRACCSLLLARLLYARGWRVPVRFDLEYSAHGIPDVGDLQRDGCAGELL